VRNLLRAIDLVNEWVGRIVSLFIFPIIGAVIFEVLMRYFLRRSQLWVPETSVFLFGALFVLGGGYAYLHDAHVRLDAVYERFSPRSKAIADVITSWFSFLFCVILIWKGAAMAWDSFITLERSPSAFAPLLFPLKMLIPIGSVLFLLHGLTKFIRDLLFLWSGDRK
jgi:TRAP-type mannitol/chloroaromatic compound transport system permease small subunit